MYHVELRQFPHNFCHFNLTERELHETILEAWAQGEWIEMGERKWSPHQATLTVLEGPRLPVEQLSMGRGWRNAKRQGEDVTEQLLAAARAARRGSEEVHTTAVTAQPVAGAIAEQQPSTGREAVPVATPAVGSAFDVRLTADSLGLEVLAKLGEAPVPLANVWQRARERYPEHPVSDCLKLAEYAVRSLVDAKLAVLLVASGGGAPELCAPDLVEQTLQAIDSWSRVEGSESALIRRT